MSRRKVRLTRRALTMLDQTRDWTAAHFGPAQAERYLAALARHIEDLAEGRVTGRDLGALVARAPAGYQYSRFGRHFVIHVATPDRLDVIDIIHQSMDVARRLP